VFTNPMFGNHKHILPGEGDLIVDDLLVDIKTTENGAFTNAFWRQLLMYYVLIDVQRVLHDVDGRTYGKEPFEGKYPEINQVGIYYARYGELQTVDIEEVIDDREQYEEFRAWIVDRAIEENSHAQHDYSAIRAPLRSRMTTGDRRRSLTTTSWRAATSRNRSLYPHTQGEIAPIFERISSFVPAEAERVQIDIPDETDHDHQLDGEHGRVVEVLQDDSGTMTGDERDSSIYRVRTDGDGTVEIRWHNLRPPLDELHRGQGSLSDNRTRSEPSLV